MPTTPEPALSAIVVHWRNADELAGLVDVWPRDPRFELVMVDNSGDAGPLPEHVIRVEPGTNLGFGGAVARGAETARAPIVLILNPDAHPRPGALDAILDAFAAYPEAAGIVPALEGPDGRSQHRWQLRPLPTPTQLVMQTLFLNTVRGPHRQPAPGTPILQPAAAALALRREALDAVGGFDTRRFYPAWFEDVDLARRLHDAGNVLRYAPDARFVHTTGASVPALGYGRFLWLYHRNLEHYLERHHGRGWVALARVTLVAGMLLRLLLLPFRRPRRARTHRDAFAGLAAVVAGALSGWRRPAAYRTAFTPPGVADLDR